jgi:hypothetical protein
MKTKKSGAYAALAAVLLISAVLITNCVDPINPGGLFTPKDKDQPAFVLPPGKGYVKLNFGAGRTIRPTTYVANAAAFTHFDVVFTPSAITSPPTPAGTPDPTQNKTGLIYSALIDEAFVLANGGYIVEVYAFDVAHSTATPPTPDLEKAIAYGFAKIAVADGEAHASIILSEIKTVARASGEGDFEGTGEFSSKLTNAAVTGSSYAVPATTIAMSIVGVPTAGTPVTATLLAPGTPGTNILQTYTHDFEPGIYRVTLTLSGGTRMVTQTITEILHIYQGMTSEYIATLPALGRNIYDVLFTYGDEREDDSKSIDGTKATEEVTHGNTLGEPGPPYNKYIVFYDDDDDPITPDVSKVDDTWEIEGWYTASSLNSADKWNFDSKFYRDAHLYAKWEKTGAYVTVSYSAPEEGAPVLTINDGTNDLDGTSVISLTSKPTLTISFPNPGNIFTGIVWTVPAGTVYTGAGTNSITIDLSNEANAHLWIAGGKVISVEVNGNSESAWAMFNIGDAQP